MKFFAINGSNRNKGNTSKLLNESLCGIKEIIPDAKTEYINLYDIPFNGCNSCFECKRINGKNYGKCAYKDDFKPVLDEIVQADGIILGSPVYFGDVTGNMRSFLERFLFPFFVYDKAGTSLAPKKMPLGFIYTMNVDKDSATEMEYQHFFSKTEEVLEGIFTKPYHVYSYDTYQFDYSKYKMELFTEEHKAHVRDVNFPIYLKNSFNMGMKIAEDSLK